MPLPSSCRPQPASARRHRPAVWAVHDGHERSEFGRMQASQRRSMPMPRRPSLSSALPARRSRTHLRSTASSFALPTPAASRAARPASPFKPNSARRSRLSDRLLLPLRVKSSHSFKVSSLTGWRERHWQVGHAVNVKHSPPCDFAKREFSNDCVETSGWIWNVGLFRNSRRLHEE